MSGHAAESGAGIYRCWALIDGNPCEGRARHEGDHHALTMTGTWLSAPGDLPLTERGRADV